MSCCRLTSPAPGLKNPCVISHPGKGIYFVGHSEIKGNAGVQVPLLIRQGSPVEIAAVRRSGSIKAAVRHLRRGGAILLSPGIETAVHPVWRYDASSHSAGTKTAACPNRRYDAVPLLPGSIPSSGLSGGSKPSAPPPHRLRVSHSAHIRARIALLLCLVSESCHRLRVINSGNLRTVHISANIHEVGLPTSSASQEMMAP